MKLYYFTDNVSAEQKAKCTIESIEVDAAAFNADSFIVSDQLSKMNKRWYGPLLHKPSIKAAIASIDITKIDSSLKGEAIWGLNLNTMKFDYLGQFVDFHAEEFDESFVTDEVYGLFPNANDLQHFKQLSLD